MRQGNLADHQAPATTEAGQRELLLCGHGVSTLLAQSILR
jgi:hypothetical protein